MSKNAYDIMNDSEKVFYNYLYQSGHSRNELHEYFEKIKREICESRPTQHELNFFKKVLDGNFKIISGEYGKAIVIFTDLLFENIKYPGLILYILPKIQLCQYKIDFIQYQLDFIDPKYPKLLKTHQRYGHVLLAKAEHLQKQGNKQESIDCLKEIRADDEIYKNPPAAQFKKNLEKKLGIIEEETPILENDNQPQVSDNSNDLKEAIEPKEKPGNLAFVGFIAFTVFAISCAFTQSLSLLVLTGALSDIAMYLAIGSAFISIIGLGANIAKTYITPYDNEKESFVSKLKRVTFSGQVQT